MSKAPLKITAELNNQIVDITIDGNITYWGDLADGFKKSIDALIERKVSGATLYINTPGGDCFVANEITNHIKRLGVPMTAKLGAMCASAGTYIACSCNKVIASENTSYMIHKPITYVSGNSDQLKADLKLLENLEKLYKKAYTDKTGMNTDDLDKLWVNDFWMDATEAKAKGFVDEIDGQAVITPEDVAAIKAYKNAPHIVATATQPLQTLNPDIMKQLLITALALTADVSDTQVLAHIDALKAKALKADDLQKKLTDLQNATLDKDSEAVLTVAIADKKFTAQQKEFWKKQLIANFDETKVVIDGMPKLVQLSTIPSPSSTSGTADKTNWTYGDYMEKDPKALEALSINDETKFMELFNAYYGKK